MRIRPMIGRVILRRMIETSPATLFERWDRLLAIGSGDSYGVPCTNLK